MSIQQNLARSFRILQKIENISVSLIDDHIDKWEVNYTYPDKKEVTLRFDFHLKELLPPKIIVVFPASIQYVCFQELGTVDWKNNNDVVTLIYALQTEYLHRGQTRAEGKVQTAEEGQAQWKFVQGAHKDWGYVDVVELSKTIEGVELDKLREEASQAINEEQPAPQNDEQLNSENKQPEPEKKEEPAVAEKNEQIHEQAAPENHEQVAAPENQEQAAPPENQEPAVISENKEQPQEENEGEMLEMKVQEKKEEILVMKRAEPVQENREDLLQDNQEEIVTN